MPARNRVDGFVNNLLKERRRAPANGLTTSNLCARGAKRRCLGPPCGRRFRGAPSTTLVAGDLPERVRYAPPERRLRPGLAAPLCNGSINASSRDENDSVRRGSTNSRGPTCYGAAAAASSVHSSNTSVPRGDPRIHLSKHIPDRAPRRSPRTRAAAAEDPLSYQRTLDRRPPTPKLQLRLPEAASIVRSSCTSLLKWTAAGRVPVAVVKGI